jgi:ribosome-associated protein
MFRITETIFIEDDEIVFEAVRSQGPGGQKVNKTSSAIHLRFDINASSLPAFYKERFLSRKDSRITKEGVIVIKSQQHRSQEQNKEEALNRLAELIKSAGETQKKRVATRPTKGAVKQRLQSKKKHGEKKQMRKKVDSGE